MKQLQAWGNQISTRSKKTYFCSPYVISAPWVFPYVIITSIAILLVHEHSWKEKNPMTLGKENTCCHSTTEETYSLQRSNGADFNSTSRVHHCVFAETWDGTIVVSRLPLYREACFFITMHYTFAFQAQHLAHIAFTRGAVFTTHAFSSK